MFALRIAMRAASGRCPCRIESLSVPHRFAVHAVLGGCVYSILPMVGTRRSGVSGDPGIFPRGWGRRATPRSGVLGAFGSFLVARAPLPILC